jgi:hypothetical protein
MQLQSLRVLSLLKNAAAAAAATAINMLAACTISLLNKQTRALATYVQFMLHVRHSNGRICCTLHHSSCATATPVSACANPLLLLLRNSLQHPQLGAR